MVDIIKGDIVRHPVYGLGQAAHEDHQGRWVTFKNRGGHWAAGVYHPSSLEYVGKPSASQIRLNLRLRRQAE